MDSDDDVIYYDFPAPCSFGFHHKGMRGYYIATIRVYSDDTSVICYGHPDIFNTVAEVRSYMKKRMRSNPSYTSSKHVLLYPSKSAKLMEILLRLKCVV